MTNGCVLPTLSSKPVGLSPKRAFVLIASLIFVLTSCASTRVVNQQKTIEKNSEKLIAEYGFWKRDCSNREFDIHIIRYPKGGELRFEVGSVVIPKKSEIGRVGACAGKSVDSKRLYYIPHREFTGTDSFEYVFKSTQFMSSRNYFVDIEVR